MKFDFLKFRKSELAKATFVPPRLSVKDAVEQLELLYEQSYKTSDTVVFIDIAKHTIELIQFLIESFLQPSPFKVFRKHVCPVLLHDPDLVPNVFKSALLDIQKDLKDLDKSLDELKEIAIKILPGDIVRLKSLAGSVLMHRSFSETVEGIQMRNQLFTLRYDLFIGMSDCLTRSNKTFCTVQELTAGKNKDKLYWSSLIKLYNVSKGIGNLAHIIDRFPFDYVFGLMELADSKSPGLIKDGIEFGKSKIQTGSKQLSKITLEECHSEIEIHFKHLQSKLIDPMTVLLFNDDPVFGDHKRGLGSFNFYIKQLESSSLKLIDLLGANCRSPSISYISNYFYAFLFESARYELALDSLRLISLGYLKTLNSELNSLRTLTNSTNPRMEVLIEIQSALPGIYEAFSNALVTAQGVRYLSYNIFHNIEHLLNLQKKRLGMI